MTPAERKYLNVEGGSKRAQCLVRVLRDACAGSLDNVDPNLWGGIYIMACEAETALDAATEVWTEAQQLALGGPKS